MRWMSAALAVCLLHAGAWAQTCPSALPDGADFVAIPAGCPAPADGVWYPPASHEKAMRRLRGLAELVKGERQAKEAARAERDAARAKHTEQLSAMAEQLTSVRESLRLVTASLSTCSQPPSRAVWAGAGALGGAAVLGLGVWLGGR